MDRLISKLGLFLTCLFSLFFLALLFEILYVLFSNRQSPNPTQNDVVQAPSFAKRIDLLRRLKLRNSEGRIEPSGAQVTRPPASESTPVPSVEDLMKMHAYSRLLFPIQEETEREDMDYLSDKSPAPRRPRHSRFNSGETVGGGIDSMEILRAKAMKINIYCDETPFQTPCDSPVTYYTPSASPHG